MDGRFEIVFKNQYVAVTSTGRKHIETSRSLFKALRDACEAHDCYRVLGIGESSEPMAISDAYDHADLFNEIGIDSRFRIAWVELNPVAKEPVRFIEDVLFNRSLPGRVFDNVDEARAWLLADAD
jgi:hypothetical protein